MEIKDIAAKVDALDLSMLVSDMMERGESREQAERSVAQYRQFFASCALHPEAPLVPTHLCDKAWHAHMLRPVKYARDCMAVLGHLMDHDPGVYRVGEFQDAYDLTRGLVPYGAVMPLNAYEPDHEMAGAECWRKPLEPGDNPEDPLNIKIAA